MCFRIAAITASMLFLGATDALAAPLTCDSSADDIWRVYDLGAKEKIGSSMTAGDFDNWVAQRLPTWDVEVVKKIWFATDDYSTYQSPLPFGLKDVDLVRELIVQRCLDPSQDPCSKAKPSTPACISFYDDRYKRLFQHVQNRIRQSRSSPLTNNLEVLNQLVSSDFTLEPKTQILLGSYVILDRHPLRHEIGKHPIEQVNLRVVDAIDRAEAPIEPAPRGEFERAEDYAARIEAHREQAAKRPPAHEHSFIDLFQIELNRFLQPRIVANSVKYDPDQMVFRLNVELADHYADYGRGGVLTIPMSVQVPIEDAPQVKKAMIRDPSVPYPLTYMPWLVFSIDHERLLLIGGYMMIHAGENKAPYRLVVDSRAPRSFPVGRQAAYAFRPIYVSEVNARLSQRQREAQAHREQMCQTFKSAVMARNPQYYDAIVATSGCR
jgi:hypothetical protein